MASFSADTKTEICGGIRKTADRRAFLTGAMLACRRFSADGITVQTECEAFAAMLPLLMQGTVGRQDFDTEFRKRTGKQAVWGFSIPPETVSALCKALEIDPAQRDTVPARFTGHAFAMFAAGCFVMAGSVTDPERRYHLEIVLPDAAFAEALRLRLQTEQPSIAMKATSRKGDTVLYLKQNEQICDALTYFGAPSAAITMIDQQVYRSVRSQTNRRTNCDLANIDKTVAAGAQQAADIQLIAEKLGLDSLPDTLREIARLRLDDPEANLRDLGALCKPPLSRSGVHHRLQRISALAEKLRKQQHDDSE
ncbi:MAG TPA: DNA-binding protein WhiA [Ruminococcus sp.]|nr:DNA-binding protein WhiA [Ruminococcus sp.]